MFSDDINELDGDESVNTTTREKFIRREQIYESLENILNEIETFSGILVLDYTFSQITYLTQINIHQLYV